MATRVGATIDPLSVPIAAARLGIRNASMSGVVRAALALFHGHENDEAIKYAIGENKRFNDTGPGHIVAQVPDELAKGCGDNRSFAIRVGLGLAMGMSRQQAEHWAKMPTGEPVKLGRPRKTELSDEKVQSDA